MSTKYVCFSGIIGAGKTELIKRLQSIGNGEFSVIEEPCIGGNGYANNWLLADFYADMKKHAFAMQVLLLQKRVDGLLLSRNSGAKLVLMDRCFQEDAVFAKALQEMGCICEEHGLVYSDIADTMETLVGYPDLIVFLDVDPKTAMERCTKRGRTCEAGLDLAYFQELAAKEHAWINNMVRNKTKVLVYNWNCDNPSLETICEMRDQIMEILEL